MTLSSVRLDPHAAIALCATLVATLVLALLLPGSGRDAGATTPSAAALATPNNVTPALARLAQRSPAQRVDVIVQMRRGVPPATGRALVRDAGGSAGRGVRIINGFGARMTAAAALRVAGEAGVRAVSLDAAIEPRDGEHGGRRVKTSFNSSIGAHDAWRGSRSLSGRGVGVALVDTGVAGELPDFRVSRRNRLSRVRVSAVVNPRAADARDHYGHGTHIAGLIAGNGAARDKRDPLRGDYMGVAPGASLVSIKTDDGEGRASVLDVIYGVQFAVDHRDAYGIRVLNLSLSSTVAESYLTDPLDAAVEAAWFSGIVVVAAAGNSGAEADSVSFAPGNDPFVITVGAVDDQGTDYDGDDKLASWSSRGRTKEGYSKPELLAPGAHLISTLAPGSKFAELCPDCVVDGEYFKAGGTSMATAIVSGAAALVLEARPRFTPDQVKAALVRSARDVPGAGSAVDVDGAARVSVSPQHAAQTYQHNPLVDPADGSIDYSAASWRAASWRGVELDDPLAASFTAASWRCDCSLSEGGAVDPSAASWRGASWRTSFTK